MRAPARASARRRGRRCACPGSCLTERKAGAAGALGHAFCAVRGRHGDSGAGQRTVTPDGWADARRRVAAGEADRRPHAHADDDQQAGDRPSGPFPAQRRRMDEAGPTAAAGPDRGRARQKIGGAAASAGCSHRPEVVVVLELLKDVVDVELSDAGGRGSVSTSGSASVDSGWWRSRTGSASCAESSASSSSAFEHSARRGSSSGVPGWGQRRRGAPGRGGATARLRSLAARRRLTSSSVTTCASEAWYPCTVIPSGILPPLALVFARHVR